MIKISIYFFFIFFVAKIQAQTLIATSLSSNATANHNQRKIVRDSLQNIFVVFTDSVNQQMMIKGVKYDKNTSQWGSAINITNGNNPTLSISKSGRIHLVYETNDSISKIKHTSSSDFITWSTNIIISDTNFKSKLPVADVDAMGILNIFWKQENTNLSESLIYSKINGDILINRKIVTTKNNILDIAVANHLQYIDNDLFFAIQFNNDSVQFFRSVDNLANHELLFEVKGVSSPCISFNSYIPENDTQGQSLLKLLFLTESDQLFELESGYSDYSSFSSSFLQDGVDYTCIDDVAPPIGYSYLFMQDGSLYHGFSYGSTWFWSPVLDTISSNPFNPSIAYKTFNFSFVDFIWMENNGEGYNIFHKRDEKHIWMGIEDYEKGKDFSIIGYPNPFSEKITINISVDKEKLAPVLKIYNTKSQIVKNLIFESNSNNEYTYTWDGTNQIGNKVDSGIYIIMCTVGNKKTVRKVAYINK